MHEASPEPPRGRSDRRNAARLHARRPAAPSRDGEGGKGVSKRDYYEVLGVSRTGDRERDQERLPEAGDEVPPRSQSGRQGRRGDSSRRRPKPTRCWPMPRSAACTTASATPASASGAGGGGFDPSVFSEFGDFADILGNMFGFGDLFGGGRRRGGPQRGADLRYDLEISFEESARGTETHDPDSRARKRARPATARAPRRARRRATCPQCRGQGQVRFQQGFFTVARTCPQCRGAGKIITKPCATCHGAGRVARERKLTVKIPAGIADRPAASAAGRRRSGRGRRPAGPPVRRRPRAGARVLPARRRSICSARSR